MARCDLENHPKACAITQSKYKRPECKGCPTGEKHLRIAPGAALSAPAKNIPEIIPKSIPGLIPEPEKEGGVDQEKVKENIVRVLGSKGSMTISSLKLFAGNRESREDFRAAVDALADEGKVITTEGAQAGSLRVALPGVPAGPSPPPSNDATVPSKKPRSVNRKSAAPPLQDPCQEGPLRVRAA